MHIYLAFRAHLLLTPSSANSHPSFYKKNCWGNAHPWNGFMEFTVKMTETDIEIISNKQKLQSAGHICRRTNSRWGRQVLVCRPRTGSGRRSVRTLLHRWFEERERERFRVFETLCWLDNRSLWHNTGAERPMSSSGAVMTCLVKSAWGS